VAADLTERRYDRIDNFTFRVGVKSNISLELIAEDVDSNQFTLQARPQGFSFRAQQMSFTDLTGVSLLRSTFSWYPFCDQRTNSDGFDVLFTANEVHCGRNLTDSLLLKFIAVDSLFEDFNPPNLITVNGDGKNDTFTLINVMPDDNCDTKFEQIEIYSRWGRRVFQSNSRNFEWSPIQVPAGMYYYLVRLNTKSIKGWVQVTK
jgi:gliding motility-associated-like protein